MKKPVLYLGGVILLGAGGAAIHALAQSAPQVVKDYQPVTEQMLENPGPDDWLMYSRTFDAQRFSPLKQINKTNVNQLRLAVGDAAWTPARPRPSPSSTTA